MSAQPVEHGVSDLVSLGESDLEGVAETGAAPDPIEVRRNAALTFLIGAASSSIGIAYLWRAAATGAPMDWLLCVLLALLAALFLRGLLDSRTPLLIADEMGVRVRLGQQWRGLPWEAIERIDVTPRASLWKDGRVVITLHHLARAIEGLEPRGRRHAALNRKLFGGALAVPLGLTTRTGIDADRELGERLDELAQGRTQVLTSVATLPVRAPKTAAGVSDPADENAPTGGPQAEPLGAGRRTRWRRRAGTVRLTDEAAEATYLAPERAAADPEVARQVSDEMAADQARPATRAGRSLPFRIGGRVGKVDQALPHLDEIPLSTPPTLPAEEGQNGQIRAIARLMEPVAPLVIDDFQPEPAYNPVIGPELAAARTRVGLTVDQLADRTRIRPHVIESIEVDDFVPCGGDFYARGHIRTLARVLGKNPDPMLAQFDERYATAPVDARKVFEAELATGLTGSMRSTVGGPNWTLLVGVVLTLVLLWSGVRLFAGDENVMLENPPPVLNGSAGLGNVYGEKPANAPSPVEATLTAVNAGTHVEVRDGEGSLVFEGDLIIGEVKTVRVDPPVTVSGDNGAALSVSLAGKDLGFLGDSEYPATQTFQRPNR